MLSNKLPNYPIDTSAFVIFTSFGGTYPTDNSVTIDRWKFTNLKGVAYTPQDGSMGHPEPGKMAWSKANGKIAPFYFQGGESQHVNVTVVKR